MCDITKTFTAIRKALESVDVYQRADIFKAIMEEMDLKGRDEYLAMKAYGFLMCTGLDYEEAYKVLGKEYVDQRIAQGTLVSVGNPITDDNLDFWCDPIARQKYYEEYLVEYRSALRRTDNNIQTHPNFTIAAIEHTMRKALQ